jgi:hypothetical protein
VSSDETPDDMIAYMKVRRGERRGKKYEIDKNENERKENK